MIVVTAAWTSATGGRGGLRTAGQPKPIYGQTAVHYSVTDKEN